MIANYHSHSRWCRHGSGELEEYVKEGIRQGLTEMAVCEHIAAEPSLGPRMPWSQMPAYLADADRVISEYGDQIQLLKAFECEYFPEVMDRFLDLRDHQGVRCWILGQHESADHQIDYFQMKNRSQDVLRYTEDVLTGLRTGLFQILAHPDVVMVNYEKPDDQLMACMDRIFAECEKLGVAVEINANGLRRPTGYPNAEIWKLSRHYKLTTIISSDAHNPAALIDDAVRKAEQLADAWGITITEKLEFPL